MLDGVSVDPLTSHFLRIAQEPSEAQGLQSGLRSYLHDARNLLASIKISLYLARRDSETISGPVWSEIEEGYHGLARLIERVHRLSVPEPARPIASELGAWLDVRRAEWSSWLQPRGLTLEWGSPGRRVEGWFDPRSLIEGLDALIAWRAAVATPGNSARIAWKVVREEFHLEWSEPGAVLTDPMERREGRPISLALPILARVMTAHEGSLTVRSREGFRVELTWPIRTSQP